MKNNGKRWKMIFKLYSEIFVFGRQPSKWVIFYQLTYAFIMERKQTDVLLGQASHSDFPVVAWCTFSSLGSS
jgi:hypothetical protein